VGLDVGFDVVGLGVGFDVVGLDVGFDVLGLDVVGLDVVGFNVVGLDVVGLDVVGLDVVGVGIVMGFDDIGFLVVVGLDVVGFDVVGLNVVGLDEVGFADVGLSVARHDPPSATPKSVGTKSSSYLPLYVIFITLPLLLPSSVTNSRPHLSNCTSTGRRPCGHSAVPPNVPLYRNKSIG
jgi:hypothetical protein